MNQNNSTIWVHIWKKTPKPPTTLGSRLVNKIPNWGPLKRIGINLTLLSMTGLHSVILCIFLTVNVVWKCVCPSPALASGSGPCPSSAVTSHTPHCVSLHLGLSHGYNHNSSHLNNAVVICQTPLSVFPPPRVCRRSWVMLRDRCLSRTMYLRVCVNTHMHAVCGS